MQNASLHLDPARFAELVDDLPNSQELAHLEACARCRSEQHAYDALLAMAQSSAVAVGPRLTEWDSLAVALRREGLLTSPAATPQRAVVPVRPLVALRSWRPTLGVRQMAAAAVLMVGGTLAGRVSAGASLLPHRAAEFVSTLTPTFLASAETAEFSTVQQASETLYRAQRDYERASLWLAGNDTTMHSSDVYRARLAALDQMMTASRAALRESPQDPVLTHYFQAAYSAREATLQALGGALPVDKTLERY